MWTWCISARRTIFIFEEASLLLRAGKHVLCEKPLTMDSRESEILVSIAKETGKVAGVAYNLRYYPLCHEARALVEKGAASASPNWCMEVFCRTGCCSRRTGTGGWIPSWEGSCAQCLI